MFLLLTALSLTISYICPSYGISPKPVHQFDSTFPRVSEEAGELARGIVKGNMFFFSGGARKTRVGVLVSPLSTNVTFGKSLPFLKLGFLPIWWVWLKMREVAASTISIGRVNTWGSERRNHGQGHTLWMLTSSQTLQSLKATALPVMPKVPPAICYQ